MMTSRDDGRSWGEPAIIAEKINEGVLLPLAGEGWLCIMRTTEKPVPELGRSSSVPLHRRRQNCGPTRSAQGFHKHPPHPDPALKIIASPTYGNRRNGNIEARLSSDDGKTWDTPCAYFKPAAIWAIPAPCNFPTAEWSPYFTRNNPAFRMATTWVPSAGNRPR